MDAKELPALPWYVTVVLALVFVLSLVGLGYENYRAGAGPGDLALSSLMLALPVGLMCFSIGLLVVCVRRRNQGQLSGRLVAWLVRLPRVAAILFIFFLTLFSLDVFGMEGSFWMKLGGFVIHSIPSILLVIALVLAWRWPWVGFGVFMLAALFFLRSMIFNPLQGLGMIAIFTGPLASIALLFGAAWLWRKELHGEANPPAAGS